LDDIVYEGVSPSKPHSPRPTGRGLTNYRKLNNKEINSTIQINANQKGNIESQEFQSQDPLFTTKNKSKITWKKKHPRVTPRDPNSPRPGVTFQSLSSLNVPKGLYLIPNLKKISLESNKFIPPTPVGFFTPITPVELNTVKTAADLPTPVIQSNSNVKNDKKYNSSHDVNIKNDNTRDNNLSVAGESFSSACITSPNTARASPNKLRASPNTVREGENGLRNKPKKSQIVSNVSNEVSDSISTVFNFDLIKDIPTHNNNETTHTNNHRKDQIGQYENNKSFAHNPCDDSDSDNEEEKRGRIRGGEKNVAYDTGVRPMLFKRLQSDKKVRKS
jgi:hypothetical protein